MEKVGEELLKKVLIIDEGRPDSGSLADILSHHRYSTATGNLSHAAKKLASESPDLLILNSVTSPFGRDLCGHVKRNSFTAHIPIIVLGQHYDSRERIRWITSGADLCLESRYEDPVLLARIESLLWRNIPTDELTRLPTIAYLHRELDARLAAGEPVAIVYADIDHFNWYTAAQGQEAANGVLLQTAHLAVQVLPQNRKAFAGHIGADDFMMIMQPDGAETVASTLIDQFRAFRLPGLTLSAALISNTQEPLYNYMYVSFLLNKMMTKARALGGDRWVQGL